MQVFVDGSFRTGGLPANFRRLRDILSFFFFFYFFVITFLAIGETKKRSSSLDGLCLLFVGLK